MKIVVSYCFIIFLVCCFAGKQTIVFASESSSRQGQACIIFDQAVAQSDTMSVVFWKDILSVQKLNNALMKRALLPRHNQSFNLKIDSIDAVSYLSFSKNPLILNTQEMRYLVEPGDNIWVSLENGRLTFKGRGAAKYNCISAINDAWSKFKRPVVKGEYVTYEGTVEKYRLETAARQKMALDTLAKFKEEVSAVIYEIIKVNVIGITNFYPLFRYWPFFKSYSESDTTGGQIPERLKALYLEKIDGTKWFEGHKESIVRYSDYFISALLMKLKLEQKMFRKEPVYNIVKREYEGELREKIITTYLLTDYQYLTNADSLLDDAMQLTTNKDFETILNKIKLTEAKGAAAYDFRLPDPSGRYHSLSDYRGKVVFIDFWYTGCIGCAAYYKGTLRDVERYFSRNENVVFVTINIDADVNRWKKSIASGLYTSSHVVNLNTEGRGDKHPVIKWYNITAYPRPMLIDRGGMIVTTSNADLRSLDGLKKNIRLAVGE